MQSRAITAVLLLSVLGVVVADYTTATTTTATTTTAIPTTTIDPRCHCSNTRLNLNDILLFPDELSLCRFGQSLYQCYTACRPDLAGPLQMALTQGGCYN